MEIEKNIDKSHLKTYHITVIYNGVTSEDC